MAIASPPLGESAAGGELRTHPALFLVLNLPFGITTGFIVVSLPFVLSRAGVSVAVTGSLVAFALSPKVWKFLWAPIPDLTLSMRAWYAIGALFAAAMLIVLAFIPVRSEFILLLAAAAFLAEVGTSFLTIALGGLMGQAVAHEVKGRAAGFYQLGAKVGHGFGGGAGIWLGTHSTAAFAPGVALGLICALCVFGLAFVRKTEAHNAERNFKPKALLSELAHLFRSPQGLFVALLVLTPIGISGIGNFWSGVATEWRVGADLVAAVTGPVVAFAAGIGCLAGGWLADRYDRRVVYLGCGGALACLALFVAEGPRDPAVFISGSVGQAFLLGFSDAAFSALILSVIGVKAAATKFAVLAGLGNIPDIYMTALSGFVHDAWGTSAMLELEALLTAMCILAASVGLSKIKDSRTKRAAS